MTGMGGAGCCDGGATLSGPAGLCCQVTAQPAEQTGTASLAVVVTVQDLVRARRPARVDAADVPRGDPPVPPPLLHTVLRI